MLTPDGEGLVLQHVSIEVADLERSIEFYRALGLVPLWGPVAMAGRRVAWFRLGAGQELHLIESDGSAAEHAIDNRKGHFALSVAGDFSQVSGRLAERFSTGRVAEGGDAFHGQHYFTDPDGNLIEVNKQRDGEAPGSA